MDTVVVNTKRPKLDVSDESGKEVGENCTTTDGTTNDTVKEDNKNNCQLDENIAKGLEENEPSVLDTTATTIEQISVEEKRFPNEDSLSLNDVSIYQQVPPPNTQCSVGGDDDGNRVTKEVPHSMTENVQAYGEDGVETSSNVSSSSSSKRRMKQADIRDICTKVKKRKLTDDSDSWSAASSLSNNSSNNSKKTDEVEPVIMVIDGEEEIGGAKEPTGRVSTFSGRSRNSNFIEDLEDDDDDEARLSLCRGYQASLGSSKLYSKSLFGNTEDDESEGGVQMKSGVGDILHRRKQQPTAVEGPLPDDARLPELFLKPSHRTVGDEKPRVDGHLIRRVKEEFAEGMRLSVLENRNQNPVHETDVQLITSAFNAEVDFYVSMLKDSAPVGHHGLRMKSGCSLNNSRENCPSGLFEKYVPHVLYSEDFVAENEWLMVLARYYDEYLNNAPFLFVMSHVVKHDENVVSALDAATRNKIYDCTQRCLSRFKNAEQPTATKGHYVPRPPYDEKCTVVIGLLAICSTAFKMVTPVFTDLAKTCRLLLGKSQQTSETLNTSTMPTTSVGIASSYSAAYNPTTRDDPFLDESVSQVGCGAGDRPGSSRGSACSQEDLPREEMAVDKNGLTNYIGNDHSVIASILRWNYDALCDQTRWCLFFYYYHVHADGLTRILDEVVHGALMVTAVLQAYFESYANNRSVDIGLVCRQVSYLDAAFCSTKGDLNNARKRDDDKKLMPPPSKRRVVGQQKSGRTSVCSSWSDESSDEKRRQFEKRNPNSKKAQRKVQEERNGRRTDDDDYDEEEEESVYTTTGKKKETEKCYVYKTDFNEVVSLFVNRYLRPVSFDEMTVVYTETGYEPRQNEFISAFSSCNKDKKASVKDIFSRSTLRYSMPHGDLSMFNTDVMGAVHSRSSCTNNLVLNIFENMYGGCMTYLTRRYNNNLNHTNRFSGNAYRLVVECRHATKELIQSIELSYINLILRQPVVPPVLESDIRIRNMFMSGEEIMKGSFVCLNSMDYVRSVNMFTRQSRFLQENCDVAESFLDEVIAGRSSHQCEGDEDARMRFRTIYLFFLLYTFEVLYKIRHTYNRDRTYNVSVERLSRDVDVRMLLKLFFGSREFKMPQGLSAETLKMLNTPADMYEEYAGYGQYDEEEDFKTAECNRALASRCINTRPTISAVLVDKEERMIELFKKKGIVIMKSYAPRFGGTADNEDVNRCQTTERLAADLDQRHSTNHQVIDGKSILSSLCADLFDENDVAQRGVEEDWQDGQQQQQDERRYEELERTFLEMTPSKLEDALYSSATWYENCRVRMIAAARAKEGAEQKMNDVEMCLDAVSMDTFLRTQLRVTIDNDRLNHIDRAVRNNKGFEFCTRMPLRTKMIALVLATHATKRMAPDVAADFVRKEYRLERSGVARFTVKKNEDEDASTDETRPDVEWEKAWNNLLDGRIALLTHCRSLADTNFPDSYFIGLRPDDTYNTLYNYMLGKPQYKKFHELRNETWARDVCVAMNFLLVMNAYDTELVELCLRLFLAFEWPGQWAKRIFVWKSNSNAGKSFFFESIISKVFDHSTTINDPKGGKDNAPEKSEYYKNFLLMINEFNTASACELKRLCSMSGYKFRMNFGNQMIQAYMVGKMVFNCNTLPLTTDHATIQRVALIPLPFWFNKRQTVVDSMLNWTMGQSTAALDYENNFRRRISRILTAKERQFFIDCPETKNESDLFNEPDEYTLKQLSYVSTRKTGAPVFLVQNKTSQVYMSSSPATGTIISGIMAITRYFCRFRYFNKIKEPVDFSTIPTACTVASREWERFSQPYYEWKERYRVEKDTATRTKVSVIHASLSHFAKNYSKNTSFFDLRQFFEVDFVDSKIQYYNTNREDEYYVRLDPLQD